MIDDLLSAFRLFRNVDSSAPKTTLGKGRKIVQKYLFPCCLLIIVGVGTGFLRLPDGLLLSLYTVTPFILDSSLFLESLPIISRLLPRATILVEIGMEIGMVGAGISLSLVIWIYRKIGAASMAISWFNWKRNN
jgi:hypothetical protein